MTRTKLVGFIVSGLLLVGAVFTLHHEPALAAPMEMAEAKKQAQLWTCGMHPQVIQDHPGNCPICHMKLTPMKGGDDEASAPAAGKQGKVAYWWDPMLGPPSITDHPGKSAMGMDLVAVYEDSVRAGPGVRIDPAVVQNMGVLTAPVTRGPLDVTVRAVGMLEVPEPSMHDVTLRVSGYVEKLYADTQGMVVAQGDVLFDLYSADLQVAAQELIAAQQTSKLGSSGESPNESQRMVESAKRKLRQWGIAEQDIDAIAKADRPPQTVPFRSPATGHIEDKSIVQGSAVQAGMKLMRIEDHRTLWLNAEVYADQIEAVKIGQDVTATVDGVAGKTFSGKVAFVYPHVDHMTRTETVRTVLENPDHALRPGMFASVQIVTRPIDDAILVPREAVIDTGVRQIAFIVDPMAPGHFLPRQVRMGVVGDEDKVQMISGLAVGDVVVTSGQFLMDVESRTTEAIQKLRAANANASMTRADAPMSATMPMPPASMPMTSSSIAATLSLAHCPMKKADWLQAGDTIRNPFFGSSMPTCGSVTRQITVPPADSSLGMVAAAVLKVTNGLAADRLDPAAQSELMTAIKSLPAAELKASAQKLAATSTIDEARKSLAPTNAALVAAIDSGAR